MRSCFDYLNSIREPDYDPFTTLMVHDELVFDFPAQDMERNLIHIRKLCSLMEDAGASLGVETPVEATLIVESWDKGQKLEKQHACLN